MAENRGLPAIERIAVGVMAFAIASMNGVPYFASSGLFCLIGVVVLTVSQLRRNGLVISLPAASVPVVIAWGGWVFAATIAAVANLMPVTITEWFWVHLLPLIMLISLLGLRPSRADILLFISCLAVGWIIRFGYAGFVFYQTWGIPGPSEILLAHFNIDRIRPYMNATFGNTSRTAALIVPAMIMTALTLAVAKTSRPQKVLLAVTLAVLAINSLIAGSRAQVLVAILVLAVAGLKSSARGGVLVVIGVGASVALLFRTIGASEVGRFSAVLSSNRLQDGSVRERWDSIQEGLRVMSEYWLGVGPGRSPDFNYYSVAHQFAVFQGSETGILGFLAVIVLFVIFIAKFAVSPISDGRELRFVFRAAAAGWFMFAMLANSPLGLGANMPWAACLVLMVAFGEIAPLTPPAPKHGNRGADSRGARAVV